MQRPTSTARTRSRGGSRRRGIVGVGLAWVAAGALMGACSDGRTLAVPEATTTAPATTTPRRTTTTTTAPAPTTTLPPTTTSTVPPAVVPNLGAPVLTAARLSGPDFVGSDLTAEGQATVTQLVADYVSRAVAGPVGSGQPADLTGMLSSVLAPRLTAEQRAALTDEGVPRLTAVTTDKFEVAADGLAGPDGSVGVVNCRLELQISGLTAEGGTPVTIYRRGDLTYVWETTPAGGGAWLLDSFTLAVDRTLP